MLNYVGPFIVFLAAVVAIKGGTWDERKEGIKKITLTGWIAILISIAGLITSFYSVYGTSQYQQKLLVDLNKTQSKLDEANKRLNKQYVELLNRYVVLSGNQQEELRAIAGSIVKTYGFDCAVEVITRYSDNRLRPREPREIPLIGNSGEIMSIRFYRSSSTSQLVDESHCGGKVIIMGTGH